MRRGTPSRLTSLFLLLAFLGVGTAEAFAVRECPHHDLPGKSIAADAASSHDGEPRSASVSASADEETEGEPADTTDHPCSCVGTCHAAADAPLGSSEPAARGLVDGTALHAPSTPAASPLPPSPAYLLPYPNGPPLSA